MEGTHRATNGRTWHEELEKVRIALRSRAAQGVTFAGQGTVHEGDAPHLLISAPPF